MMHNITTTTTSTDMIEAYNSNHNSWTVPAPAGAKVGDDVLITSRDGVQFLSFVAGLAPADEMIVRVRG